MLSEDNNNNDDPGKVNDPGGVYQPEGPLTFEKVWLMFQETDKKFQATDKKFQATDKKMLKTDKKIQETDRIVRNISKEIGGIGNNLGEVSEEYFRAALASQSRIAGVKIEKVDSLKRQVGKLTGQFDIVLFGKKANIVVEVKHRLQQNDVNRFLNNTLPSFKKLYPEYCKVKIIGAVAGMTVTDSAIKVAFEMGLLVFTQSGQKVRLLNPEDFEPKEY